MGHSQPIVFEVLVEEKKGKKRPTKTFPHLMNACCLAEEIFT